MVALLLMGVAGGLTQSTGSPDATPADRGEPEARAALVQSPLQPNAAYDDGSPESEERPTWFADQLLVAPRLGERLADIAASQGATVLREVGPSGYGLLQVPDGMDRESFRQQLLSEGRVGRMSAHARIQGAKKGGSTATQPPPTTGVTALQWHLAAAGLPATPTPGLNQIVVAVLDTGVAYENYTDTKASYLRAPSLATNPIVAPWDFVNGDAHANDDHQHGTHMASIIGSMGSVTGTAPGVGLMPLKVLDQSNSGYEIDLVDAIYWATDHGADIISMSLSFSQRYLPSEALQGAIAYAVESGVVLVGAAGNEGHSELSWPAASHGVIAVGSYCAADASVSGPAPYSNRSGGLSLVAPGGCLDRDSNRDGYADGIIAETISPKKPLELGYWMGAGTSQAAAVVTGAAAQMLAAGGAARRGGGAAAGQHGEAAERLQL